MSAPTAAKPQKMATRTSHDGYAVHLWDDGCVTYGGMATVVAGAGVARSPAMVNLNIAAGWLVLGDVALYDRAELPALVKAARKAVRAGGGRDEMRRMALRAMGG